MSRNRASHHLGDAYAILRRPILTEKSHDMVSAGGAEGEQKGRYTFEVHVKANKDQIRRAVEAAFGVTVESVNTMIVKPRKKAFRGGARKIGLTRIKKKAVIRLAKNSKPIELI
jgi:large subunit ribosomal protein L23